MESRGLMKNIDNFFFDKITALRSSSLYSPIPEFLSNLDDDKKDFVKYIISIILTLIPLLLILFFWWSNRSYRQDLETRKGIYTQANQIISKYKLIGESGKQLISSTLPNNENDFISKVNLLLAKSRIDSSKVKIQNFKSESFSEQIQENSAEIIFNELSTQQFSNFTSELVLQQKMKIGQLDINRNSQKKQIEGKISIVYLSAPGN